MTRRLSRTTDGRPAAPVRIIHLGLGNFFRAHQAWYTEVAPDAHEWGIAAFTGRSLGVVPDLEAQGQLYTLIIQGPRGNNYQTISSLSATHSGTDLDAWIGYFTTPELAIVTSTITEAGYLRGGDGRLDVANPGLVADLASLQAGQLTAVSTAPGKFVAGLLARRAAGLGALTFCPCDNVPDNGEMLAGVITDLAKLVDETLLTYLDENVTFVTTMVDRITPRPTSADREVLLHETGVDDPACVATEPFVQWVLSGEFAGGRPVWEIGGAQFVDDVRPYEQLKLWMLNGSHTLMAYAATIKGHETVCDAINDPQVRGWVESWWDVAARHLPLDADVVAAYRAALIERYANPSIRHLLAQIAADGSQKVPIRLVPALVADRAVGGAPIGAERAVAAWVLHLRGLGAPVTDARADEVRALVGGSLAEAVAAVCDWLEIADVASRASVLALAAELSG